MWGIWCNDEQDWLRELPSKVDDGGEAILAFDSKRKAHRRAAKHYGKDNYTQVKRYGWAEVKGL